MHFMFLQERETCLRILKRGVGMRGVFSNNEKY